MFDSYLTSEALQLLYFILCVVGVTGIAMFGAVVFALIFGDKAFMASLKQDLKCWR